MISNQAAQKFFQNDEVESIRNLIASAILDPSLKGGLRWPLRKATSLGDRYQVVGVWHTISRVYESPSLRLKVRDADRFDFKTSFGETTGEVTLKLKGVASELLVRCNSFHHVDLLIPQIFSQYYYVHYYLLTRGRSSSVTRCLICSRMH